MARRSAIVSLIILSTLLADASKECLAKDKFVKYSEAMRTLSTLPSSSVSADESYELAKKNKKLILFDARQRSEYLKQHIAGASLPMSEEYYKADKLFKENITRERPDFAVHLKNSLAKVSRDSSIITYCHRNCGLSKTLANELKALGFKDVRWMEGGIDSWREKGYPLES